MTSSPGQVKTRKRAADAAGVAVSGDNPFSGRNCTKKHRAAILLAEDEMSDQAIADELHISRTTLHAWKTEPEFAAVVGDYQGAIIAQALKLPIAKKYERIRQLNDLNERYWAVIEDRAEMYGQMAGTPEEAARAVFGSDTVPWAKTGLMVQQPKIAANGKTVVEWAFDRALDSAIKETHKQAAQELGQWAEKSEVEVDGGMRLEIVGMAEEDLP